ncbi:hypothetical protein R1flu_011844 [Riccia fluitans]|uniref:Uncharacterized protein n=1 Tax=Riccia fluitans TaxID=41844 RepID=A0ABD1ZC87_9MARC
MARNDRDHVGDGIHSWIFFWLCLRVIVDLLIRAGRLHALLFDDCVPDCVPVPGRLSPDASAESLEDRGYDVSGSSACACEAAGLSSASKAIQLPLRHLNSSKLEQKMINPLIPSARTLPESSKRFNKFKTSLLLKASCHEPCFEGAAEIEMEELGSMFTSSWWTSELQRGMFARSLPVSVSQRELPGPVSCVPPSGNL